MRAIFKLRKAGTSKRKLVVDLGNEFGRRR
jgi:hypothetical protein